MVGAGIASTSKIGIEDFSLINPAVLSTSADLLFASGYAKGEVVGQEISGFSLSILDSSGGAWNSERSDILLPSSGFPLASILYYSNFDFGQFKDQYFHLGIAQPLTSRMSLGLTANYSILKSDSLNVSDNIFDFGAGFLWRAFDALTFGVSTMNLSDNRNEHIEGYLRRSMGIGAEYAPSESVKIRLDYWRVRDPEDQTRSVIKVGVTNTVMESFILQFGFADDQSIDSKVIGVGFIIAGPKLSLSYAFKRETSYPGAMHSVDIRIPVW